MVPVGGSNWDKACEYFVPNWDLILFCIDLLWVNDFSQE